MVFNFMTTTPSCPGIYSYPGGQRAEPFGASGAAHIGPVPRPGPRRTLQQFSCQQRKRVGARARLGNGEWGSAGGLPFRVCGVVEITWLGCNMRGLEVCD